MATDAPPHGQRRDLDLGLAQPAFTSNEGKASVSFVNKFSTEKWTLKNLISFKRLGALRTPSSALRTPSSALRTPSPALRTPSSALRTPSSALERLDLYRFAVQSLAMQSNWAAEHLLVI